MSSDFSIFPTIQVSEQQVRMEVLLRQQLVASLGFHQVRVNDGEWHHLLVELRSVKDDKDIKYMAAVSLDYGMYQVQANYIRIRQECTYRSSFQKKKILIFKSVFLSRSQWKSVRTSQD